MIKQVFTMPVAALIGVLLGLIGGIAGPQIMGSMTSIYDDIFPVLSMSGRLVDYKPGEVTVHITGRKNRGEECRLIGVYGYTYTGDRMVPRKDAIAQRIDLPQSGRPRSEGFYDIGIWRVWPVGDDAKTVEVWTHHECYGRPVQTKVADISIPKI